MEPNDSFFCEEHRDDHYDKRNDSVKCSVKPNFVAEGQS